MSSPITVLYFSAPWCAPCKRLAPIIEKLQQDFSGAASFTKINADEDRDAVDTYDVRGIPTVMLLRDDTVLTSIVGEKSEEELRQTISSFTST